MDPFFVLSLSSFWTNFEDKKTPIDHTTNADVQA